MPLLRSLLAVLVLAVLATGWRGAPAHAAPSAEARAAVAPLRALTQTVLDGYGQRDAPADPRYFADGVWVGGAPDCWTCNASPGVAAAVLAAGSDDAALAARATATFDRAIADHAQPDGSFAGAGGRASAGVDTAFFLGDLGTAALQLAGRQDAATRGRWARALAAGADYLIGAGHTTWYANGNLNLRYTHDLYLAWRVTGQRRFRAAYEASWRFTLTPPKPRWAGFGLRYLQRPSRADGADGRAYLTESDGGTPGFDPAYTEVQADVAAALWTVSRDPRALRLMRMLLNAVAARVDPTGTLDARDGSRKSLLEPFMTPALAVAVAAGADDLAPLLAVQQARIAQEYRGALGYAHPNFYRGLSTWLAPTLIAYGMGRA